MNDERPHGSPEDVSDEAPGPEPAAEPDVAETPEPLDRDALSPAVRRLVKQYDLDVTGIRGTGPGGRLRVADVMGALSGRGEPLDADDSPLQPVSDRGPASLQRPAADAGTETGSGRLDAPRAESRPEVAAAPATTVFDCELAAALERRAQARERGADVPLLAWFAAAASRALRVVPELKAGERIHVAAERAENGVRRTTTVADADTLPLHAIARALEMPEPERGGDEAMHAFVVYDYGASGSLLAMPLPLRAGHAAALGVGAPRRELAFVRTAGGEVVLRAVDRCYLTLTYDPARVTLERANRFLAEVTRSRPE
ncbi:MAG TPA: E3 binding domain-containing protein [Gammaproteobacteria bacterium]